MYGTPEKLRERSQITANDLYLAPAEGQTEQDRFTELLTELLEDASEIVDLDRDRNFDTERRLLGTPVPKTVVNATLRIAGNMIENMIDQQNSKRIKRDDGQAGLGFTPANVIDEDVRQMLDMIPKGNELPATYWPRFSRVRSLEEIELDAGLVDEVP